MLKREGPQEWIFQEYGELAKMHFRFKDREIPRSLVVNVVDDLLVSLITKNLRAGFTQEIFQEYPTEEVLAANYLVSAWKPELIAEVLSKLTPDNCRLTIILDFLKFHIF
jgi:insulysin